MHSHSVFNVIQCLWYRYSMVIFCIEVWFAHVCILYTIPFGVIFVIYREIHVYICILLSIFNVILCILLSIFNVILCFWYRYSVMVLFSKGACLFGFFISVLCNILFLYGYRGMSCLSMDF